MKTGVPKIWTITHWMFTKRPRKELLNFARAANPVIQCRLANNPSQNKQGDIMVAQSDKPSIDPVQRCDLCEQKINPTVKIYNNDIRLCKACFGHMENLPEVVAKSVERFLIGNVV
jgi:hypothetical protein